MLNTWVLFYIAAKELQLLPNPDIYRQIWLVFYTLWLNCCLIMTFTYLVPLFRPILRSQLKRKASKGIIDVLSLKWHN